MGIWQCARVMAVCLGVVGCTQVPFDAPRSVSRSADRPANYHVGTPLQRELAVRPGQSAFIPLPDGNDALGARLRMIDAATQSIDMQYFLIKPDLAGGLVSLALLQAADRGVRIRFLLDDALTTAEDDDLSPLDAHPNIEVRLTNPLSRKSSAIWNFIADFQRVNRRMHNKSMTVDRTSGIIGGRNIADEYFRIDTDAEFADFDLFVAGPLVQDIADQFDLYWNDPLSVPLAALHTSERVSLETIAAELEDRKKEALTGIYGRAVRSTYIADVSAGKIKPFYASARISHDDPDKLKVPVPEGERVLAQDLLQMMASARTEVLLVTPYFVPEDWGARFFTDLAARGVRVRIVTNSLASTNHAYVHAGYKRHRKALLAAGVELYEVRADAIAAQTGDPSSAGVTMHTKLAVVDSRKVFVGSMNFDPRSIKINTEFGIFVDDPAFGTAFQRSLDEDLPQMAYSVHTTPRGNLAWLYANGDRRDIEYSDPGASLWRKFVAGLTGLLPVEGQL